MKANSAIKIRLYPTPTQARLFDEAFKECVRWYNIYLEWFKDSWKVPKQIFKFLFDIRSEFV